MEYKARYLDFPYHCSISELYNKDKENPNILPYTPLELKLRQQIYVKIGLDLHLDPINHALEAMDAM